MHRFGHLPRRGERIVIDNYLFKILRADNRRVHMLQLTVLPKATRGDGVVAVTVTGNEGNAAS